VNSA